RSSAVAAQFTDETLAVAGGFVAVDVAQTGKEIRPLSRVRRGFGRCVRGLPLAKQPVERRLLGGRQGFQLFQNIHRTHNRLLTDAILRRDLPGFKRLVAFYNAPAGAEGILPSRSFMVLLSTLRW